MSETLVVLRSCQKSTLDSSVLLPERGSSSRQHKDILPPTKELQSPSKWMTYLGHVAGNKFPLCDGTLNRVLVPGLPRHDSRCVPHIQEFYELTLLDESKSVQQKTAETNRIAAKWEASDGPITPTFAQNDRPAKSPFSISKSLLGHVKANEPEVRYSAVCFPLLWRKAGCGPVGSRMCTTMIRADVLAVMENSPSLVALFTFVSLPPGSPSPIVNTNLW
uniref:Uncharacterized protein n=1 Tax=Vespula pensylvanica TaxID=30213 RepID=A0A834PDW5_VESPE|nr:hypothetical protein H0235_000136 [Vespula pensylvanica]